MEPQNIKTILALKFDDYGVAPVKAATVEPFLGKGIFTSDGADWAEARAMVKPIFTRSQITDFSSFSNHVDRALALVPRNGEEIDLQPIFKKLYLDVSTEFLFGESTNTLDPDAAKVDATGFITAFDQALTSIRKGYDWTLFKRLRGKRTGKQQSFSQVQQLVDKYVAQAFELRRTEKIVGDGRIYLVDELLKQTNDRYFVRSQLLNFFAAARDTAPVAISDVFFQLARHPDVWSKLRSEVVTIREPLSFDLFKSMTYLQSVLKECLRLIAPAGFSRRGCLKDSILPTGGGATGQQPTLVQKGDIVQINFQALQHDEELWGKSVEEFRLERWETARPSWEYLPFLGGARVCPAQQMMISQLSYIVVRFVQEFAAIRNRDPEERFVEQWKLLCESRNGVKVSFTAV
ncbi:MAG: hypothetical protein M1822_003185 [Bathelium mastoideum]|nr:MAG: hypothetical protein M1822_003185 [Bathelium mastoideum]